MASNNTKALEVAAKLAEAIKPEPIVLDQIFLLRVVELRREIREREIVLAGLEADALYSLKNGGRVEPGILTAYVAEDKRRCPKWKEILVREVDKWKGIGKGVKFCARVTACTKPSVTESVWIGLFK